MAAAGAAVSATASGVAGWVTTEPLPCATELVRFGGLVRLVDAEVAVVAVESPRSGLPVSAAHAEQSAAPRVIHVAACFIISPCFEVAEQNSVSR